MIITNLIIASYCSGLYNEIAYRRNPTQTEFLQCENQFSSLSKKEIVRQQELLKARLGQNYLN